MAAAARWLERSSRYSQEVSASTSLQLWESITRGSLAAGAIDGPGITRALDQIVGDVRAGEILNFDAVAAAEVARIGLEAGRLNDDLDLVRRSRDTLELLAQIIGSIYTVNDSRKLTASANAAVGEFELARLGDAEDMQWVRPRLAELADRLRDTLGPDDPRTLAFQANVVIVDLEVARLRQSSSSFAKCLRRLEQLVERQSTLLGSTHEQALTSAANLACARFELALRTADEPALDLAASGLAASAAACAHELGDDHPVTLVLRQQLRFCTDTDQSSDRPGALGGIITRVRQKTRWDHGDENYASFELAGQRLLRGSESSPSAAHGESGRKPPQHDRRELSDADDDTWTLIGRA
ncbi:hypothetical protein, partial [Micromonospora sp. H61]|uniref:hypothetical protein n=1 Tax=Micromonospora sp. H61 TaxID=2824888 RepID=UPI001B36ECBA